MTHALSFSQQCGKKAWEQQFAICSPGPPFAVCVYIYIYRERERFYVRLCVSELSKDIPACRSQQPAVTDSAAFLQSSLWTPSGVQRVGGWTLVHAQKMPWADPSSSEKVIGPFLLCLTFFVNLGITSDSDSVSLEILCLSADLWMSSSPWKGLLSRWKLVAFVRSLRALHSF